MAIRRYTREDLIKSVQLAEERGKNDPTRHRCFVSYHKDDLAMVGAFIDTFGEVFIPKTLGVRDEDPLVNSDDRDYIMRKIRENYLTTSTVTIVLCGQCTWARRYVDWEVASSLRNDSVNKRSGLLALTSPGSKSNALPPRVADNWTAGKPAESYASYKVYPTTKEQLRSWIEAAYQARSTKATLVKNSRALKARNSTCP